MAIENESIVKSSLLRNLTPNPSPAERGDFEAKKAPSLTERGLGATVATVRYLVV